MANNPDWIFYQHDGPTEADIMPRLVADFPGFRPRWEQHLKFWEGEPAGNYNDITQFVYFVVRDLHPSGNTEEVQHAFDPTETLRPHDELMACLQQLTITTVDECALSY